MAYSDVVLATAGLVSYWRLGESAGSATCVDAQSGHNGTTTGHSPTLGVTGALTGDSDTAATFVQASSQYIDVAHHADFNFGDGPFSVECWVKLASTTNDTNRAMVAKGGAGATGGWEFRLKNTAGGGINKVSMEEIGASGGTWVLSTVAITDLNWHHVVGTKNSGGTGSIFMDGVDRTSAQTNPTLANTSVNLQIGASFTATADFMDGSIDEVAIYNVALSLATAQAHYTAGSTVPADDTTKPALPGMFSPQLVPAGWF